MWYNKITSGFTACCGVGNVQDTTLRTSTNPLSPSGSLAYSFVVRENRNEEAKFESCKKPTQIENNPQYKVKDFQDESFIEIGMEPNIMEDDIDNLEPVIEINNMDQSNKNNISISNDKIITQLK